MMRRTAVFIALLITCIPLFSLEVTGSPSTGLVFRTKDVEHVEFGISSTLVDNETPEPTLVEGDVEISVDESFLPALIGKGTYFLYWDIFSLDGYEMHIKITDDTGMKLVSPASGNDTLHWGMFITREDGSTEYTGADTLADYYGSPEHVRGYGGSVPIFEESGGSSDDYYKLGSAKIQFITEDAQYKARGEYNGEIRIEVQTT